MSCFGKLGQLPNIFNGDHHENRKEIFNKQSGGTKTIFFIFFMHKFLQLDVN